MSDLYEQLRERFDSLATGLPKTESRVELEMLKRLYSEEQAHMFLDMSPFPESPSEVATRLSKDEAQLHKMLEAMASEGLLFRLKTDEGPKYMAIPFIVGVFEFQVERMATDKKFADLMKAYGDQGFVESLQSLKTPHLRTIPVNSELVSEWPISPHDDLIHLVKKHDRISLTPCICRTGTKSLDISCDKPVETCFAFGHAADFFIDNGWGREVTQEEAIKILKECEAAGLVPQASNDKGGDCICNCCGDCCGMLKSLKLQPNPAEAVKSSYFAVVERDDCVGCEVCIERCQMDAIVMDEDEKAIIKRSHCIGCGLCISTCPGNALKLQKKPEEQLYDPPANNVDMNIRMMTERGIL